MASTPTQIARYVHYDCQDNEKLIAAYDDIGVGPAVIFDGAGFTDAAKLRAFIADLTRAAEHLPEEG